MRGGQSCSPGAVRCPTRATHHRRQRGARRSIAGLTGNKVRRGSTAPPLSFEPADACTVISSCRSASSDTSTPPVAALRELLDEFDPMARPLPPAPPPAAAPAAPAAPAPVASPPAASEPPSTLDQPPPTDEGGGGGSGTPNGALAAPPGVDRALSRDVSVLRVDGGASGPVEPDGAGAGAAGPPKFSFARFLEQWRRPETVALNASVKRYGQTPALSGDWPQRRHCLGGGVLCAGWGVDAGLPPTCC